MKPKNQIFITFLSSLLLAVLPLSSCLYAQEPLAANSVSLVSGEDKLQALASTRFHFITLKQFHSSLFSSAQKKGELTELEAGLLNAGLNVFLTSAERETMLLEALRENRSVRINLPVSKNEEVCDIEVKPLLDKPIAFQIILNQDGKEHLYRVDWSGNMATESVIGSLA